MLKLIYSKGRSQFSVSVEGRPELNNPKLNSYLALECSVCFLVSKSLLSIMFCLDQY